MKWKATRPPLRDAQWASIAPLLAAPTTRGRPWVKSRRVFEAVLWVLWNRAAWEDLPDSFPSPSTCWRRLGGWVEDGSWFRAWPAYVTLLSDQEFPDWADSLPDGERPMPGRYDRRLTARRGRAASSRWWRETARVFREEARRVRRDRPPGGASTARH